MICSATLGHDVHVSHDDPFRFAARFVAHDGELSHKTASALYEQFAELEQPELRADSDSASDD